MLQGICKAIANFFCPLPSNIPLGTPGWSRLHP